MLRLESRKNWAVGWLAAAIGWLAMPAQGQPIGDVWGQAPAGVGVAQPAAAPSLQWQILQNPNSPLTMVVVDPIRQVVAVYQIDPASGLITLKSVRPLGPDLRLDNGFNATEPLPKAVREMTDER